MKNLVRPGSNSLDFFLTVVDRKHDHILRAKMHGIQAQLGAQYSIYDNHFANDTLAAMVHNYFFSAYGADLRSLYEPDSRSMRELIEFIQDLQPKTVKYTCQCCTLTLNESLDHILPQGEFPEYAIHISNLFPCCKSCNAYKSYVWRKDGTRLFLNLYLDELPEDRYLFVRVTEDSPGDIGFDFYLENIGEIQEAKFRLITTHFDRLHLFERMRMAAVSVIASIENDIQTRCENLQPAAVIDEVLRTARRNMVAYGNNYWKSVVEIALIKSPIFQRRLGW